jgi:hypothetical protein
VEPAQTLRVSAKDAESNFDRSVSGRYNAVLDADNEPMFSGNLLRPEIIM